MIPRFDAEKKQWAVPDAKEFVQNCRWEDGKFIVPATIEGEVFYKSLAVANTEAKLLDMTILSARQIEAKHATDQG